MKDYPLVVITWLDHTGNTSWKTESEVTKSKPASITTIGWLIHEDRGTVKLCNSIVDDGDLGGESLVLKNCITDRYEIELD